MKAGNVEVRWKNTGYCKVFYVVAGLGNGLYLYNHYHYRKELAKLQTVLGDKVVNPVKMISRKEYEERAKKSISLGRLSEIVKIEREAHNWQATVSVTYRGGKVGRFKARVVRPR